MKKITYKTSNLFTLKKYKDSNLNCTSYEYMTIYGLRCAILGSVIQLEGIEKAKELFHKIKNSNIYIQYPEQFNKQSIMIRRCSNNSYGMKDEDKYDQSKIYNQSSKTMGVREYVDLDEITFYIDNMIPNIDTYLKNIDWLGTAESMVYLHNIEEVTELKNVLIKWNNEDEVDIYEQHDWSSKTTFDTVYMYSPKYKHIHNSYMCKIEDIEL